MHNLSKVSLILLLLVLVSTGSVKATPVYGTNATLTGSTNLTSFGDWAGNANLAWNIAPVVGGYSYTYTFTHLGSDLSHLILEFTAGCGDDPACITSSSNNFDGPRIYNAFDPPNFEMPAPIYGTKFNSSGGPPNILSFVSNRAPVWGDVYLRDGGNAYAYNTGLLDHTLSSTSAFVARPDGSPDQGVPEPGGWLILGFGLFCLGLYRNKKKSD